MRITGIFGILSLAALMMAGCQADESLDKLQGQVPIYLTATVSEPGNGTRAATDVQSGTQFGAGETFYAYFPTGVRVGETTSASSTSYTTDGSGGTTAATQPYFNTEATSANVCAYYPYVTGKQVTAATTSFSVETDQTAAEGFKKSDLMFATSAIQKSSPTSSLSFSHKMAKIIVNVTIGAGISKVTGVRIVGGSKTIAIANPATTDETSAAYLGSVSTADADQITADDGKFVALYSGEYTSTTTALACAGLIPPQTVDAAFLQVVTAEGAATYSVSKAFTSGAFYTYNITVNAAALGLTTAITEWDNQSTQYLFNLGTAAANVEYVDLGLSVKWANMNVGAASETDGGLWFAWGDIRGSNADIFYWSTYKWKGNSYDYNFSKYVPTDKADYWAGSGSPDNKLMLDPADDAATAFWGSNWRMPTKEEWEELLDPDNCTWTWEESPVKGYRVTSKKEGYTSNSIFLPSVYAAGKDPRSVYSPLGYCYWSSTLKSDNPRTAWNVQLHYYDVYDLFQHEIAWDYRVWAYPIRPVYDEPYVDLGLSVKWAKKNVGAASETDDGMCFAWGDISGSNDYIFDWSTYKWKGNSYDYNFSKYVPTDKADYWAGSGSPDNKLMLDPADDAARVNWGSNWRMPKKEEWEELLDPDNCTWTWEESPVKGYRVTSKKEGYTSSSIFLPAVYGVKKHIASASFYSSGGYFYWSSTLLTDNPGSVWGLRLCTYHSHALGDLQIARDRRTWGFPVRPVYDE